MKNISTRHPAVKYILICAVCAVSFALSPVSAAEPDSRKVFVAGSFPGAGVAQEYASLKNDIISLIRSDMKGALLLVNTLPSFSSKQYSNSEISSDEFRRTLCVQTGAAWIIHAEVTGISDGADCTVYMYDYYRDTEHALSFPRLRSYKEMIPLLHRDMQHLYLMISSLKDFYLHRNDSLLYVRDIADFGFTGDPVSLNYPCGVTVTEEGNLLAAASGTVAEW
ncbi:MAG: hypothetical protein ACRCUT_05455, partial [Spirochaetota bacterium]